MPICTSNKKEKETRKENALIIVFRSAALN